MRGKTEWGEARGDSQLCRSRVESKVRKWRLVYCLLGRRWLDVRLILDTPTSTPSPFLTKAPSCCHNSQTIKNKTSLDV